MIPYGKDYGDPLAPSGAELLDDLHGWFTDYVAWPSDHAAVAVTLWDAHTYFAPRFESSPRLALVSPEPACAKTRALELLELTTTGGWLTVGPSAAALYRRIEQAHDVDAPRPVTLLLDEADTIWKAGSGNDSAEAVRMIVNSGHRRRAVVPRVDMIGAPKLRMFRTYAPVALASKGDHLPDTIMSRSVVIRMRRRAPDEHVRQFRERITRPEGERLQARLADWSLAVWDRVGCEECEWPEMPPGVTDRPADVWEPLLAVAELAGGDWPKRARAACRAFVTGARDESVSAGIRLLADVRKIFGDRPALFTEDVLRELYRLEEAPYADWFGRRFTARDLAKILRPYGIESRQIRIGDESRKGYAREQLWDAWRRYGVLSETSETSETPLASTVSHVSDVSDAEGIRAEETGPRWDWSS